MLTWMHLSDLHVSGEDWQRDDVLSALIRDLPELLGDRELRRPRLERIVTKRERGVEGALVAEPVIGRISLRFEAELDCLELQLFEPRDVGLRERLGVRL